MNELFECELCPRNCKINRSIDTGYCKVKNEIKVAKASLHMWEEPCISGENGSGTIFFTNCNLGCVFCQNHQISHNGYGMVISVERLSEIMLELQEQGANNINLVTPTPYITFIKDALDIAKRGGLNIPIIYNSSGYENEEALKILDGYIDIYLPDIKYYDSKYGLKYSKVSDYFQKASKAILEMLRQVGVPKFDGKILKKGLMVRHLMIPGLLFDSKKVIDWVINNLPKEVYLNIMCQYTPVGDLNNYPEINRKLSRKHYETLLNYAISNGVENGFFQDFDSSTTRYIPNFDLKGV
ncbi:radical SAM protein [Clostridium brassicae]|uniref:Radical SAM protein n=1 Tax=Clostridium brassicae TaxID=2999072 RepID=A0ABT4DHQ7_9CLOT|nr:radical SAM protein [Clostridium brassicae]MCY6960726.1 radical SAM protein [Clostridium brassicae]